MKKIKLLSRIVSMMLSVSVFVSAVAGYGTRTVYADTRREGDIVYLDSEITDVSDDTVNEWAMEAGLIEEPVDSESICTKMDLIRVLWFRNCRPEYKADALTTKIKDVSKEDIYAALWAYKKGISALDAQKNFKPDTQLTHGDVLQTLWFVNGKPIVSNEITGFVDLDTSSTYYLAVLWAADQKLLIKDEKANFDGSAACRMIDALRYVYYLYHVRSTFPITKTQFLEACEGVTVQAREGNYHYGDSDATPPTTDGFISCDRLVAKALWDLGYTDQTPGGFANGHEDMFPYLLDHGFVQSFDIADVGYGSIVCTSSGQYGHTFVLVSWDQETDTVIRYDEGSEARIHAVQPLQEGWNGGDFLCVFNIPDE